MMKVLKWEMTNEDCTDKEKTNKLLEEGWEPFAVRGYATLFRRPAGYIEVEEKIIEQEQKPVVTKTINYNLDKIEKYEEVVGELEQGSCHDTEDSIEY